MKRIYVLKDPRTNAVRYVGQTKNQLNARLEMHMAELYEAINPCNLFRSKMNFENGMAGSHTTYEQYVDAWDSHLIENVNNLSSKCVWLLTLVLIKEQPVIEELERVEDKQAHQRERHWIEYYLKRGAKLTNIHVANTIKKQLACKSTDVHPR